MSVVPIERYICEQRHCERGDYDDGTGDPRPPTAQMVWQAQRERQDEEHRGTPGAEIQHIGDCLVRLAQCRRRAEARRQQEQRAFKK